MSNDPIILTRDKVRREWNDYEPKLVAMLISGGAATVAAGIVQPLVTKWFGIVVDPFFMHFILLGIAGFFGWWTPSIGTTVTKVVEAGKTVSETHSGNTVTTVTNSTPIQPARPAPGLYGETEVMPATVATPSQGAAFLEHLPSATDPVNVSDKPLWMQ